MRTLTATLAFLMIASAPKAEIRSLEDCRKEVAKAPEATREAAARWITLGGSTPAQLCEIAALQALGAESTAATKLTELAQNPRANLTPAARALLFTDAGTLWLVLGQDVLAEKTLAAAEQLDPDATHYLPAKAELALSREDWQTAEAALTRLIDAAPASDLYRARARARRGLGALEAALADLGQTPETPETRLERAAIWAAEGKTDAAKIVLLALISDNRDSALASEASALLERLAEANPAPPPADLRPILRTPPQEPILRPRPRP